MKLIENLTSENQFGIAAAEADQNPSSSGGSSLQPPLFNPSSNIIQRKEDDSSMQDWGMLSYAYNPGDAHLNKIKSLADLDEYEAYLKINEISATPQLYQLLQAIALVKDPGKKMQKKLKSLQTMLKGRINTLTKLKEQGADAESIEGMDDKQIASNWTKIEDSTVHFKHIEGGGMSHNPKLKTKIREVREKTSDHNWGSTGYDMFIPYSLIKTGNKGFLPIFMDPVLYIDVDVGKKEDFKKIEAFKPYYEEYQELVKIHGKKKGFDIFAEKHTVKGVTTDLPLPQDATIYHEAGHVKEFQDSYQVLMDNFLREIRRDLKKYTDKNSANKKFLDLAGMMWRSFSSDEKHETHTHIVKNEIKAMIAIYEGKSEDEAYTEHDSFNEIRDKIHDH